MDPESTDTTSRSPRFNGGDERRLPNERPVLVGVAGEYADEVIPLNDLREVYFGRSPDNELVLTLDDEVSRRHARLTIDESGRAWICDLGSTNGTSVNGQEISREGDRLLSRGDRIFLGVATIFKFDWLTDEELERFKLAHEDAKTELYNANFFRRQFPERVSLASERGKPLSLILVDIDHFKRINDTHGHLAGDHVLQAVAAILREVATRSSPDAVACRYGGEEFALILPAVPLELARSIAEKARAGIEALDVHYHGTRIPVTASAGVAALPAASADALLAAADRNLYRAKAHGRNRVE